VATWAEQYRRLWDERYDALGTYLETLTTPEEER